MAMMAAKFTTPPARAADTSSIARFALGLRFQTLPPKAVEWAKTAILDCLGVAVAGSRETSSQIAAELARQEAARRQTSVYGHAFLSSPAQAAFVNGISAHASDFDHSFVVGGQPSAPIIPAVFALGEALSSSGKQILEAYAAGFELAANLALAGQSGEGGGVPPGAYGAALACAKLLRLSEPQIQMSLAIASAMVSGLGATQGAMGKPLAVGLAARAGVQAAQLAKNGFTAVPVDLPPLPNLGRQSALEKYGVRLKPYPCGGLAHTSIYATIQLRNQNSIAPGAVESVEVRVPQNTADTIKYRIPQSGLEGKFSMPYLVARALLDGQVTLDSFTDAAVRDPKILALLEKVEMKVDLSLPPSTSPDGSRAAAVAIRMNNGQTFARYERFPKGSSQFPMTPDELNDKVRTCFRPVIGLGRCERVIAYVSRLQTLPGVKPLAALLLGK
ncbi:MAG TPA: MmgE/PrpD family protein [Bryobacteraceae bacterium]|nr:MmgE/PrpD family protein [Bryobacteraceae bacterium]